MIPIRRVCIFPSTTRISLRSWGRMHVLIMLLMIWGFIPECAEGHVIYRDETADDDETENLVGLLLASASR
jgi:hypothetical protein